MVTDYLFALPPAVLIALHALGALALLWRRRYPGLIGLGLAALAVISPVTAAMVMPYSVIRYLSGTRRSLALSALLLIGVLTGADLWSAFRWWDTTGDPYTPILVMAVMAAAGLAVRAGIEASEQRRAREHAAARQAQLEAEQGRLEDRAALALTLHDVAVHWVTLMTMQAGTLSVRAQDPQTRSDAEELRAKGERALHELYRLIGVLSSDADLDGGTSARAAAQPLTDLVADFGPGISVDLDEQGDRGPAPGGVQDLIGLVVAESLLNAAKHAPGGRAHAQVRWDAQDVTATVTSQPAESPAPGGGEPDGDTRQPPAASGAGLGVRALAARCARAGGTFDAGPAPDGSFGVNVRLPYGRVE